MNILILLLSLFLWCPRVYADSVSQLEHSTFLEVSTDQTATPSIDVGETGAFDDVDIREMGNTLYDVDESDSDRRYKAVYTGASTDPYAQNKVKIGMAFSSEAEQGLTWTKYTKQAASFQDSTDKAVCGSNSTTDNIFDGGGTVYFEVDAETKGPDGSGKIVGKDYEWFCQLDDGPQITFYYYFSTQIGVWNSSGFSFNDDTAFSISYDADSTDNNPAFYVNGSLRTTTEAAAPIGVRISDADGTLMIGNNYAGSRAADGYIKNVKLFNVSKDAGEHWSLYTDGLDTTGLVADYQMIETEGSLIDYTGNYNDCTLTGVERVAYPQAVIKASAEDPWIVKYDDIYYMYYEDKYDIPFRHINLSTSTDGVTFTEYAENPVLDYNDAAWENQDVSSPVVYIENGTWHMFYEGRTAVQNGQIGHATSSDGLTWSKDAGNPVITVSAGGAWDDDSCVPDSIIKRDGVYYLTYHGGAGAGVWGNGMATATSLSGPWTKYANNPIGPGETDIMFIIGRSGKDYTLSEQYDTDSVNLYEFRKFSNDIQGGAISGGSL